jgi:hypothetical protein
MLVGIPEQFPVIARLVHLSVDADAEPEKEALPVQAPPVVDLALYVRVPENEMGVTDPDIVPFHPSGEVTQVPFTLSPACVTSNATALGA